MSEIISTPNKQLFAAFNAHPVKAAGKSAEEIHQAAHNMWSQLRVSGIQADATPAAILTACCIYSSSFSKMLIAPARREALITVHTEIHAAWLTSQRIMPLNQNMVMDIYNATNRVF